MRRDLNTPCLPTDTLFHQFIRDTHHHLSISHPQQRHNNDYQTIGMKLVATYPKLESKQTRTPWVRCSTVAQVAKSCANGKKTTQEDK
ncbi:unnamed protein product [Didymodactylos carnosus]|uniref:Uncharacterized protein n=1 Tax=Didymodactylos carnosus TaxID=1234261 RepID=A0A8S2DU95_9BILA|nr:unnamed protein product [Didymodactylos carnosus]CAF3774016.1 unnamed protein product [Didymodactylos carnosus]